MAEVNQGSPENLHSGDALREVDKLSHGARRYKVWRIDNTFYRLEWDWDYKWFRVSSGDVIDITGGFYFSHERILSGSYVQTVEEWEDLASRPLEVITAALI